MSMHVTTVNVCIYSKHVHANAQLQSKRFRVEEW